MTTTYCPPTTPDDVEISNYLYSKSVMPGHSWTVTVTVRSLSGLWGDYVRLNVLNFKTMELLATQSFDMPSGSTKTLTFTGIMPDCDLQMNLSLVDIEAFDIGSGCEDSKTFTIKMVTSTEDEEDQPDTSGNSYMMYGIIILGFLMLIGIIYLMLRG